MIRYLNTTFISSAPINPFDSMKTNKARLVELYNQGLNDVEISKLLGVARQTVCYHRLQMGLSPNTEFEYLEPRVKNLSIEDRIYLAAFLDAEGTVTAATRACVPKLQIDNTNESIIKWVFQRAGVGGIQFRKPRSENHKPCWRWQLQNAPDIKAFLEQVLPYMKVKVPQARLVLELCNIKLKSSFFRGKKKDWSNEKEIVQEIRKLNKRGK